MLGSFSCCSSTLTHLWTLNYVIRCVWFGLAQTHPDLCTCPNEENLLSPWLGLGHVCKVSFLFARFGI